MQETRSKQTAWMAGICARDNNEEFQNTQHDTKLSNIAVAAWSVAILNENIQRHPQETNECRKQIANIIGTAVSRSGSSQYMSKEEQEQYWKYIDPLSALVKLNQAYQRKHK